MIDPAAMSNLADLAQLVTIEPGAKQVQQAFIAAGVRVMVFAFDTGQGLPEHAAPHPVLIQALQGELTVTAADRTVTLVPGGVVHFAPSLPHAVIAASPAKMALFMLTGEEASM